MLVFQYKFGKNADPVYRLFNCSFMKRSLLFIVLTGILSGCYYDKAEKLYPSTGNDSCNTTSVTYSAVVQPIIAQSCAISGCHDAYSTNGYLLTNYAQVAAQAANGNLVGSISHSSNYPAMPLGLPALSQCQISEITDWVKAGYPNN